MRILVVHNIYIQRGGEEAVVDLETDLLRRYGHEVRTYSRDNREIVSTPGIVAAAGAVWSPRTERDIAGQAVQFKPDLIHVHNTFPLISPSLYWIAARLGIPVVQTLHNFRLLCPQAMFLRDGLVCESCLGGFPWPALRHRCYRASLKQTAVLSSALGIHRALGTYQEKIARYIALSEFCRAKFIQGGLPAGKIAVKPNFVDSPEIPDAQRTGGLFVGRLAKEKGTAVLRDAIELLQCETMDIVGTGPEAGAFSGYPRIRIHGWQDRSAVRERMLGAAYLIVPSIWYESFPMVIVEAYSNGLPVIASNLGSMAEIVADGVTGILFEAGSAKALAAAIAWADANPAAMRQMGRNARREYEAKYCAEINYRQLMAIYADAIVSGRESN